MKEEYAGSLTSPQSRVGWNGWDGIGAIEGDVWIGSGRMSRSSNQTRFFKCKIQSSVIL